MRKFIIFPATALLIASALPAFASGDTEVCSQIAKGQQMSIREITNKATGMGYEVRKVEREDGCYEVYAVSKTGARVEIYMNAVTGDVLKIEKKS